MISNHWDQYGHYLVQNLSGKSFILSSSSNMNYMKMNAGFSHKSTDLKIRGLLIDKNTVLDDKEREWDG